MTFEILKENKHSDFIILFHKFCINIYAEHIDMAQ